MLDSIKAHWVESATSWSLKVGEAKRGKGEEKPLENKKDMNWTALNVINSITQLSAHTKRWLLNCVVSEWQGCCREKLHSQSAAVGSQRDSNPFWPDVFICMLTGPLMLPEPLCSLRMPRKQEQDNSHIKQGRRRLPDSVKAREEVNAALLNLDPRF